MTSWFEVGGFLIKKILENTIWKGSPDEGPKETSYKTKYIIIGVSTLATGALLVAGIYYVKKKRGKKLALSQGKPYWKLKDFRTLRCYHGAVDDIDARLMLTQQAGRCHLIRYSDDRRAYILSVKIEDDLLYHFRIRVTKVDANNQYEIEGCEKRFPNMSRLLAFYESQPISDHIDRLGDECPVVDNDDVKVPDAYGLFEPTGERSYPGERFTAQSGCTESAAVINPPPGPIESSLTLAQLHHIQRVDEHGRNQTMRLVDQASKEWRAVGILLGLDHNSMDQYMLQAPHDDQKCFTLVLDNWLQNGYPRYPTTWGGLCELLRDIDKPELALRLIEVVQENNTGST